MNLQMKYNMLSTRKDITFMKRLEKIHKIASVL